MNLSGNTQKPRRSVRKNLTGLRFGRLLVLSYAGQNDKGRSLWLCQCDCGQETTAIGKYLLNGDKQSCGCLHKEQLADRNRTHDLSRHPLYGVWATMISRCTNPAFKSYKDYGARGIRVFDGWLHSFPAFLEYVSALPDYGTPTLTLDRIDNDGNYEPGNLRWATRSTQRRNKRKPLTLIAFCGQSLCLTDWAKLLNVPKSLLFTRIYSQGWTIERAFTTPVSKRPGAHDSRI